ncbi:MAG: glycoside hydrolase family 125 protein [Bacillota bacterium]|nr:glycoside hydrolase family 125 protein [Bacillota bacterium]
MTAADFLTAAPLLGDRRPREVTGNEWVSFPAIDLQSGGLHSLTVLHEGAGGLLELAGLAASGGRLLVPFAYTRPAGTSAASGLPGGGWQAVDLAEFRWDREGEWLPGWTADSADLHLAGRLLAPPGHRGAVYRLTVTNRCPADREVVVGLGGSWAETRQTLFASRPVSGAHQAWYDEWTQTLVLECRPGLALFGWALGADRPLSTCIFEAVPVWQAAADSSLQLGLGLEATANPALPWRGRLGQRTAGAATGACLRFFLGTTLTLAPGETGEAAFFLGVGTDGDGARLTLVDLRRRGAAALHDAARRSLAGRVPPLDPARVRSLLEAVGEPVSQAEAEQAAARLTALFRRNLHFNRCFATGRALDTGRLALVTSRSPDYYVKGVFWARDTFLWSFPALLLDDPELAREALVLGLTRYVQHGPFHACYLDGRPLYPGFELDELAAPLWAFDHYLAMTGDHSLWTEPGVAEGLRLILRRFRTLAEEGREKAADGLEPELRPLRDGRGLLLPTFLDPSDDPVADHPYLTYPNVLAWRALTGFARQAEGRREWGEERRQAAQLAEAVQRGVREHLLCGQEPRRSFAMAVSGDGGGLVMGDNPAGSLALLAYLGFCDRTDPVFAHTVAGLNRPGNPFYFPGSFGGRGNRHAPFPWVVARAADLLAGDPSALKFFLHAPLDDGLACESVDPRTGAARTGAAFAAAAGWLAWCLYLALGQDVPNPWR